LVVVHAVQVEGSVAIAAGQVVVHAVAKVAAAVMQRVVVVVVAQVVQAAVVVVVMGRQATSQPKQTTMKRTSKWHVLHV
jgi:hypothetical protein